MKKLAAIAALALALSGVAAPAMASEPVPGDQMSSLTDAPTDPAPSHHKIKPPKYGTGDLYQLVHGGFNDATSTDTSGADYAATAQDRSSEVLLKSGIIVAKVAKAKALKQPKQPKQKTAKAAKPAKQPTQAAAKAPTHSKTTKATTLKPPVTSVQQATSLAFAPPPKVRKVKLH